MRLGPACVESEGKLHKLPIPVHGNIGFTWVCSPHIMHTIPRQPHMSCKGDPAQASDDDLLFALTLTFALKLKLCGCRC